MKRMEQDDIYREQGFRNRDDYLVSLAERFGINPEIVYGLASSLGAEEDFRGLETALEGALEIWAGDNCDC